MQNVRHIFQLVRPDKILIIKFFVSQDSNAKKKEIAQIIS
jgi:hypothetical protein